MSALEHAAQKLREAVSDYNAAGEELATAHNVVLKAQQKLTDKLQAMNDARTALLHAVGADDIHDPYAGWMRPPVKTS